MAAAGENVAAAAGAVDVAGEDPGQVVWEGDYKQTEKKRDSLI